jgi:hypothetical protein
MGGASTSPFFRFLGLDFDDLPMELEFGNFACEGGSAAFGFCFGGT